LTQNPKIISKANFKKACINNIFPDQIHLATTGTPPKLVMIGMLTQPKHIRDANDPFELSDWAF